MPSLQHAADAYQTTKGIQTESRCGRQVHDDGPELIEPLRRVDIFPHVLDQPREDGAVGVLSLNCAPEIKDRYRSDGRYAHDKFTDAVRPRRQARKRRRRARHGKASGRTKPSRISVHRVSAGGLTPSATPASARRCSGVGSGIRRFPSMPSRRLETATDAALVRRR